MARNRDDAICWLWIVEPWNDAPFVGLSSTSPPWRIAARARSAKKSSHEMTTPKVPAGVRSTAGSCPSRASRAMSEPPAKGFSNQRNGTYSPNGTRRTFS